MNSVYYKVSNQETKRRKMQGLQIFTFNSNEVKTTLINNEPYFNLKDICDILEIKKYFRLQRKTE